MDIQSIKSQSIMYSMISREFDLPELKLLIDAVASSKFITEKKSKELVAKLAKLASNSQADELKRNIIPEGRIKAGNENIYYIVDAVNAAINNGKQISFQYFCYNVRKQKAAKDFFRRIPACVRVLHFMCLLQITIPKNCAVSQNS